MIHKEIRAAVGGLATLAALAACGDETVNLGGGRVSQEIQRGVRCGESPIVLESVHVNSQAELEELVGCEEIDGDLRIAAFAGADLSPLASLRVVEGMLALGGFPDFPDDIDSAELDELQRQFDQAVADSYLPTLRGLERLERVGSLDISSIAAEDLSPLSGLRELNGRSDSLPDGFVGIHQTNLRSLHGLENIDNIDSLVLSDNLELESLGGVVLGLVLTHINLVESPKLTSIAELAPVSRAFTLSIINTGITDLDELIPMFVEDSVTIESNRNLVNVDRIGDIVTGSLSFYDNAVLRSIPALPNLSFLESFKAVGNPALETLDLDLPEHGGGPDAVRGEMLVDPIDIIEIGDNDSLRQISLTAGLAQGRFVAVYGNPALESVVLGTLTRLEELTIADNSSLSSLDIGPLSTVERLEVTNNPSLDVAPLAALRTFEARFEDNAN